MLFLVIIASSDLTGLCYWLGEEDIHGEFLVPSQKSEEAPQDKDGELSQLIQRIMVTYASTSRILIEQTVEDAEEAKLEEQRRQIELHCQAMQHFEDGGVGAVAVAWILLQQRHVSGNDGGLSEL